MLKQPLFIGSDIYRGSSYGGLHPLRVPRVSTVMDLSRALGWLPDAQFVTSPRAKPKALWAFHTPEYVSALARAERRQHVSDEERYRFQLGNHSNPIFAEMFRRPATGAGGVILAGELLKAGGTVHVPGGGTHHGMPDRANGFCYLNDPVLAIKSLQRHGAQRVVYVDIDAHHPDGVEVGFTGDPDVRMISTHEENRWPNTGRLDEAAGGSAFNLPVPSGLNDSEMAMILQELILPAVIDFAPDAIVLQCGSDAIEEDPLSRLALSNNAHVAVVRALMGIAPRLLVLGGGGYNPWSVGRCWTRVWGALNGLHEPEILEGAAETVLRDLSFEGNSRGRNPPDHWFATLKDTPREGSVRNEIRARIDVLRARF
ncbi:acetoin utilization protein AcuC [Planktotalea sp.]|uniref:acetoin utilization protein AcuC n=1 Tax=Planktotalea sp. TaxID=2029877 RepID=UPI003297F7CB